MGAAPSSSALHRAVADDDIAAVNALLLDREQRLEDVPGPGLHHVRPLFRIRRPGALPELQLVWAPGGRPRGLTRRAEALARGDDHRTSPGRGAHARAATRHTRKATRAAAAPGAAPPTHPERLTSPLLPRNPSQPKKNDFAARTPSAPPPPCAARRSAPADGVVLKSQKKQPRKTTSRRSSAEARGLAAAAARADRT